MMASEKEVYHWFFSPFRDWSSTYEHCHRCTKMNFVIYFDWIQHLSGLKLKTPFTILIRHIYEKIVGRTSYFTTCFILIIHVEINLMGGDIIENQKLKMTYIIL